MIEDLERLRQRCMDMARQIVEPKEWSEEWARYATVLQIIILEKSEPTFLCVSQKTHDAVCTENDSLAVQLEDMTNDRIHYQRELAMAEKERDEARAQAYQPPAKLIHMERDALAAQLDELTRELTAAKADRDAWCNSFHAANKERLAARAIGTTRV